MSAPVEPAPPPTPLPAPPAPPEQPRELLLAIALLAAVGVSFVWCVQTFALKDPVAFLSKNQIGGVAPRLQLLAALAIGALTPTLAVLVARLMAGPTSTTTILRVARLLTPFAVMLALPLLFSFKLGHAQPMYYLVALSVFALLLRPAIEQSIVAFRALRNARGRPLMVGALAGHGIPLAVVVLGALGYAAYMSYYTVLNHRLILTTAFDLGIYDNLMFNALHGHAFHSPVLFGPGERNYLAGHAELGMLLFVPIYALSPGPETLLIMQATVLGLAAIPLYLFAARSLPAASAAVVSLVYLLFAPLHGPNFYDFHWLPLAIFFHFWAYYALASGRNLLFWSMFAVLMLIREDVSVGTAVLGVFLALTTERVRLGVAVTTLSVAWFVAIKFVMMPSFGTWWFDGIYKDLFADEQAGYGSVVKTLLSNPLYALSTLLTAEKATYLLHMTAPLAFLPLRRPQLWLLALPGMAFTLLTTQYWPTTTIRFQYTTHWIPYLFLSVVLSLGALRGRPGSFAVTPLLGASFVGKLWRAPASTRLLAWTLTLVVCGVAHSYAFGAILQQEKAVGGFRDVKFVMTAADRSRYVALRSVLARIPPRVSVAATEYMSPHVSTRKESYVLRGDVGKPDYILLSSREVHSEPRKWLQKLLVERQYVLVTSAAAEFYLFKRGARDAATEAALRALRFSIKSAAKGG